jgi:hypothetical protein
MELASSAERCTPDGPELFKARPTEGVELAMLVMNGMVPMALGWPITRYCRYYPDGPQEI